MNIRTISIGIAAALLGTGLLWYSGNGQNKGIAGWETLNSSIERTLAEDKSSGTQNKATIAVEPIQNLDEANTDMKAADSSKEGEVVAPASEGKVNVNTAEQNGLMELPGIGAKKAQAILEYRQSHGPFKGMSDLGKVKGIGPKMLEKLKPMVSF
ncbi:ComEA family DNA-binding protein [Paenibacillus wynnii]|uniref:ComEA family DNA-binding protein n=1 Tax=Paenibacillus wynnii TaxID=268407 RepID=UPI00278D4F3F|nr:helix-hairpin-helix domain-containing protein [Paenibacillus wynnii]MDQ0192689.1 competence protein ComEA [Paenibacillus wynnii]